MPKARKKVLTKKNGSSSRKGKNGNGGNGKAKPPVNKNAADELPVEAGTTGTSASTAEAAPEKKRRGRAATEGEPLRRVLIFLSEKDIASLKAEVGDRGVSTKVREIIKEHLAKRS